MPLTSKPGTRSIHSIRAGLALAGLSLLLHGCGGGDSTRSPNEGRYFQKHDSFPDSDIDVRDIPNAVPRYERKSRGGNPKSYEVFGKRYYVKDSARGYVERGSCSWYGKKFHGHKTSNGETYDMFAMTAAHKTLPLPTFLKVTNLDNNRWVIVRVNDRGPFHGNRICDLSYTAAKKLGIIKRGTGRVELRAITPDPGETWGEHSTATLANQPTPKKSAPPPKPKIAPGAYLQAGAFVSRANADKLVKQLKDAGFPAARTLPGTSPNGSPLYRVRIGPFPSRTQAEHLVTQLDVLGIGRPHVVTEK